jgi:hypothetical protein
MTARRREHAMTRLLFVASAAAGLLLGAALAFPAARQVQLRYRVRAGDRFNLHVTLRGTVTTQTADRPPTQRNVYYELDAVQTIEGAEAGDAFTVRVQPLPERARLLVDGQAQAVDRTMLPASITRMSRQGEILALQYGAREGTGPIPASLIPITGLMNALPALPARRVSAGARWPLLPKAAEPGFRGDAALSGFEVVQQRECARLEIHSANSSALDRQLVDTLASQGFGLEGRTQVDSELYFAVDVGWPVAGTGHTVYEAVLKREKRVVSLTRYDFQTRFEVRLP